MHFSNRYGLHLQHLVCVCTLFIRLQCSKAYHCDPCCSSGVLIRAFIGAHEVSAALDTW